MTYNNKCDSCGSELQNSYSYNGGEIEKRTILFHQSAKLEYDRNGLFLEKSWDPRKVYFESEPLFLGGKWVEIEKALDSYKRENVENANQQTGNNNQKNNYKSNKF